MPTPGSATKWSYLFKNYRYLQNTLVRYLVLVMEKDALSASNVLIRWSCLEPLRTIPIQVSLLVQPENDALSLTELSQLCGVEAQVFGPSRRR